MKKRQEKNEGFKRKDVNKEQQKRRSYQEGPLPQPKDYEEIEY
ncbi:hypothetical protein ACJ2A9_04595 [Anaerobacillus sp. MEB173]